MVAPPEYVILMKLAYFKEGNSQKHLDDIEGILSVSGEHVDVASIQDWVQKLGLEQEWEKVRMA